MNRILLIISLLFLLISCEQKNTLTKNKLRPDSMNQMETMIDSIKILRSEVDKINILRLTKGFMESSLPDSSICSSWIITNKDVIEIIKKSQPIDSNDIHYLFETQSCIYTGIFELDGVNYSFGINSGGWMHTQFGNIVLGCFDIKCEKYYLGTVDDPEEEFSHNTVNEDDITSTTTKAMLDKKEKVVDHNPKGAIKFGPITIYTNGNKEGFTISKSENLDTLYIQQILYNNLDGAVLEFDEGVKVNEVKESIYLGVKQYTIDDNPAGSIGIAIPRELTHKNTPRITLTNAKKNKEWLENTQFQKIKEKSLQFQTDFYFRLLKNKKNFEKCCPEYITQAKEFLNADKSSFTDMESLIAFPYIKNNFITIFFEKDNQEYVKHIRYHSIVSE